MTKKSDNSKIYLIIGIISISIFIIALIANLLDSENNTEVVKESSSYQQSTSIEESSDEDTKDNDLEEDYDTDEDSDAEESENDTYEKDEMDKQLDFDEIIDYYDNMAYGYSNDNVEMGISGEYFSKEVEVEVALTNIKKDEYLESYEIRKGIGNIRGEAKDIMEGISDSLEDVGIEDVKMKTVVVDMYGQELTRFGYSNY